MHLQYISSQCRGGSHDLSIGSRTLIFKPDSHLYGGIIDLLGSGGIFEILGKSQKYHHKTPVLG